ncbi:MAG TPA: flagellar biosynthetic protein FliR [Alphaproteobacteria bacterium]|nr:flagellar biosynthetic protein FliR [Alphaproteobacteria bacterium]
MTPAFAGLANLLVFPVFLLFCRISSALLVFPSISDPAVSPRIRMAIALGVTLILFPILSTKLPPMPGTTSAMLALVAGELLTGFLLGFASRVLMAALAMAGEMIAFISGFQAATLFDPQSGSSTAAPTVFLTITAGLLILVMGFHHVLIQGIMNSYTMLPAGYWPPLGQVAQALLQLFETVFMVGLQIAAPVVVAGLMANVIFGIFNQLIPQLQVFFVSVPLSIVVSLIVLAAALPLMFGLFTDTLHANMWLFDLPE